MLSIKLFIRLFVYSNNKKESRNITEGIVKPLNDYINKIKYKSNKPYWKIDGMYVVEIKIEFNDKLNQNKFNKFLKEISNNWLTLGMQDEELISSDTNFIELEMINIFFDYKSEIKLDCD
ncbi:hypothetical protein [Terrisporobacter mayombei]|uniref:Uncharacterized protein n=1 Tax=Terrisporobacter mayombei TaxID=1541 RepID=A0ABY9Q6N1_9FIRM|nr:hypothetical protein [Terrisporobacter mayombei]MCC3868992.1 hypothetical protein [Terrisporobacter mayombei]WMT82875.1 hypothetical protein TEMA_33710 [Terrisporobacter mayombei]